LFIKQSRINSCNCFAAAIPNSPICVRVDNVERFDSKLKAFGFKESDGNGTSILPCGVNRYAKKNSEPFYTVDKSLPLEDYTQTVYWTRYEWAGKDQRNPVTDFSYITRKRYHRDYFAPYSVYFTLVKDENSSYLLSDTILYSEENKDKLLNTVNMVLGLFGECTLDFTEQERKLKRVVVNWDILPKGEYPWSRVKETLGILAKGHSKTRTEMLFRNCEAIYEKKPDFVAYGRSGFRGYAVFGFTNKNLYILESVEPNNATYVLQNDWEAISKLSKAEILAHNLHKYRIVHSENWQNHFEKMMEENNG